MDASHAAGPSESTAPTDKVELARDLRNDVAKACRKAVAFLNQHVADGNGGSSAHTTNLRALKLLTGLVEEYLSIEDETYHTAVPARKSVGGKSPRAYHTASFMRVRSGNVVESMHEDGSVDVEGGVVLPAAQEGTEQHV